MKKKTITVRVRMTPEEARQLREKSVPYGTVSNYIRSALREFSDINDVERLRLIEELGNFYKEFRANLSHAGGNLNQAVKRANELAVAGLLTPTCLEVLTAAVCETRQSIDMIKAGLLTVSKKAGRL